MCTTRRRDQEYDIALFCSSDPVRLSVPNSSNAQIRSLQVQKIPQSVCEQQRQDIKRQIVSLLRLNSALGGVLIKYRPPPITLSHLLLNQGYRHL